MGNALKGGDKGKGGGAGAGAADTAAGGGGGMGATGGSSSVADKHKSNPRDATNAKHVSAERSVPGQQSSAPDDPQDFSHYDQKLKIEDFELLRVLGKGSFGKVMLVRLKSDTAEKPTLYALKSLRKTELIKRGQLLHTKTERMVLQNIQCPFLVPLVFAFQTVDKLYMVLPYMAGGELFTWLKEHKRFSENRARLYTAELALGLEAMHKKDIIYRDLKPENIMVDAFGHLRITDFGLAKSGVTGPGPEGGTRTYCGTPEYMAPEVLENRGHGKAVDWWALGTLLFEMLTGLPPYYDNNQKKMIQRILTEPLSFPRGSKMAVSEPAKEIITRLLDRNINSRLCSTSGAREMTKMSFFSTIEFSKVLAKEYKPEFIPPPPKSETDVSNFDEEFTSEQAADSMVSTQMTDSMQDKTKFEGFTYEGEAKLS